MSAAARVLERLHNVKPTRPGNWAAGCPICESKRGRPIAIHDADDGRVLLHAFCGCDTESVLNAMGLTFADLFDKPLGEFAPVQRAPWAARDVLDLVIVEAHTLGVIGGDMRDKRAITDADYDRLALCVNRLVNISHAVHS